MQQKAKARGRALLLLLLISTAVAPLTAQSGTAALNVPWTPLAPQSLSATATGPAGGRVLSVAVDPAMQAATPYISAPAAESLNRRTPQPPVAQRLFR